MTGETVAVVNDLDARVYLKHKSGIIFKNIFIWGHRCVGITMDFNSTL